MPDFRSKVGKAFVIADVFASSGEDFQLSKVNLEPNTSANTLIDVAGVKIGDALDIHPPFDTKGLMYQATPVGDDSARIVLFNPTAKAISIPQGTWGVTIKRKV